MPPPRRFAAVLFLDADVDLLANHYRFIFRHDEYEVRSENHCSLDSVISRRGARQMTGVNPVSSGSR